MHNKRFRGFEIQESQQLCITLIFISLHSYDSFATDVYAICFITFDIQIMLKDLVEQHQTAKSLDNDQIRLYSFSTQGCILKTYESSIHHINSISTIGYWLFCIPVINLRTYFQSDSFYMIVFTCHLPLHYRSSQEFLFQSHLCIRDHPTNHLLPIFHGYQKFSLKYKAHVTFKRRKTILLEMFKTKTFYVVGFTGKEIEKENFARQPLQACRSVVSIMPSGFGVIIT